jgi:hypothetical protein
MTSIKILQDRIAILEKELADQKAKFPDDWVFYGLDAKQKERYSTFRKDRLKAVPDESVSGGRFTVQFTPTSIGTVVVVSDGDVELDLSDYSDW